MKPLTILHTEASNGWGGQEMRILLEAQAFTNLGHRLVILCQPGAELYKRAQDMNLLVETVHMNRPAMLKAIRTCREIIERHDVDLVNTHSSRDSWIASVAGRVSKQRPVVLRTRHLSIPVRSDPVSWFLYSCLPHGIITTGEIIRKEIIEKLRIKAERVTSIPTGVNIERFRSEISVEKFRKEIGMGSEDLLLGTVSVLRGWKGHLDLFEAMDRIKKVIPCCKLIVVGDGPMRPQIEERVEKKGLKDTVYLLGYREEIPEILSTLDLFVHPSQGNEGVPQAILQAMAMGKAVVASDVGCIKEVICDGVNGVLVPPQNPDRLAQQVIMLLQNPAKRASMGKLGREEVLKNWTVERMVKKIICFYRKFLEKQSRSD